MCICETIKVRRWNGQILFVPKPDTDKFQGFHLTAKIHLTFLRSSKGPQILANCNAYTYVRTFTICEYNYCIVG